MFVKNSIFFTPTKAEQLCCYSWAWESPGRSLWSLGFLNQNRVLQPFGGSGSCLWWWQWSLPLGIHMHSPLWTEGRIKVEFNDPWYDRYLCSGAFSHIQRMHVPGELPQGHSLPADLFPSFTPAWCLVLLPWCGPWQGDDQGSLPKATGGCSPQTVLCCLQSPAGETLLGEKGLWCSACFSILWVREGGGEEIISINLCYPIMGIFDWKTHHKEKAWELYNERISGYPSLLSLFHQMSGGALSSQLLTPLMSALGSWARPLLRALEKSHLRVKQTVLV